MYKSMMLFSIFGWDPFKELKDFIWKIALLVAIVAIIIAFIKFPNARIYIGVAFSVVVLVSGIICGLKLNSYYKAKGGIIGTISNWVNPTQVQIVSDTEFNFTGLELRAINETSYRASTSSTDIVELPAGSSYVLLVNNMPCNVKQDNSSSDYLIANYTYTFYNENKEEIKTDTVKIRIAFNKLNTAISVQTDGGAECAKLWNEFFNKNGFTITLTTDRYVEQNELEFGNGDVSNYYFVSFENLNETYMSVVPANSKLALPRIDNPLFQGWYNGDIKMEDNSVITEDITLTAKYITTKISIYPFFQHYDANGYECHVDNFGGPFTVKCGENIYNSTDGSGLCIENCLTSAIEISSSYEIWIRFIDGNFVSGTYTSEYLDNGNLKIKWDPCEEIDIQIYIRDPNVHNHEFELDPNSSVDVDLRAYTYSGTSWSTDTNLTFNYSINNSEILSSDKNVNISGAYNDVKIYSVDNYALSVDAFMVTTDGEYYLFKENDYIRITWQNATQISIWWSKRLPPHGSLH